MSAATEAFLAMLAAERGAAANTLAAYRRDLGGAEEAIG
ncbi:MAG: site-specific integrase, partial [Erythrobacter sp.]|nr:site-specific integrase [Erythrobacter sp.]